MKAKEKMLTYEQAQELKWFCNNCTGVRQEYYKLVEDLGKIAAKLNRWDQTCDLINEFLAENNEPATEG